jgi:hypothetical protein
MLHFFRRGIKQTFVTDASPLPVGTRAYRQRVLLTRPGNTTPYSAGDVIGGAANAAFEIPFIGPEGGFIQIQSLRLLIHSATLPTNPGGFRLHLYRGAPTGIADNAAWDLPAGDRAAYLDFIDFPLPADLGSTLLSRPGNWDGSMFSLDSGLTSLWGFLQNPSTANMTFAENGTVLDLRINAVEAGQG